MREGVRLWANHRTGSAGKSKDRQWKRRPLSLTAEKGEGLEEGPEGKGIRRRHQARGEKRMGRAVWRPVKGEERGSSGEAGAQARVEERGVAAEGEGLAPVRARLM